MELIRERRTLNADGVCWSSVFAGTFVFLAIEATFGLLAAAVFPSASLGTRLGAGPGIWMIVLSIIALYFGAKTAAHFSGEVRSLNTMYYGLITFGLSIFSAILVAALAAANSMNATRTLLDGVAVNAGWWFATLILGGIAAAIGGAVSVNRKALPTVVPEPATMRPAA